MGKYISKLRVGNTFLNLKNPEAIKDGQDQVILKIPTAKNYGQKISQSQTTNEKLRKKLNKTKNQFIFNIQRALTNQ